MNLYTAAYWIQQLQLLQHVEGGHYRQVYRSTLTIPQNILPAAHKGDRPVATAIYFLLKEDEFSAFHRIAADELWHFYDGSPLNIYEIDIQGNLITHQLGKAVNEGQALQICIKAGSWFASKLATANSFALVGCTVSPGFDFDDFELAKRNELVAQHPRHKNIITQLTRI
jgi:uncharacterized protein